MLVLFEDKAYAAVQQARSRYQKRWELTADQRDAGKRLARQARRDRLVLFMGAGTGIGAGLPSWKGLLERLGRDAGITKAAEREQLLRLDPRDAGAVLIRRLGNDTNLPDAIREHVVTSHVSLTHQLLVSLPVTEAVTTNYDVLFERAWRDAGRSHAVLPQQSARGARRWLLKLHGSVDDPNRIVLSRSDYLRFEGEGVALAGLVQAMLLTRDMLFVGYSLSDENFHRLVHQVRGAVGAVDERPQRGQFGTALTPSSASLAQDIWADDVEFVSTASRRRDDVRRLAILLDYIGHEASAPAAHLLDDSFRAVFRDEELELRRQLLAVRRYAENNRVRPALREAVLEAVDSLNPADPDHLPDERREGGGRPSAS